MALKFNGVRNRRKNGQQVYFIDLNGVLIKIKAVEPYVSSGIDIDELKLKFGIAEIKKSTRSRKGNIHSVIIRES